MQRRTFIQSSALLTAIAVGGGTTFCACTMFTGVSKMPVAPDDSFTVMDDNLILDLNKVEQLDSVGSAVKITTSVNNKQIKLVVANIGEGKYMVMENTCSHGGRELEYNNEKQRFECVSFGHSKYNLNGNVIGGPAPKALKIFDYSIESNKIIIQFHS